MAFAVVPTIVDGDDATDDFPQAVKAVADQLSTIKASGETGPDTPGPTVGGNALVIDTITIPAPGVAGFVVAFGSAAWAKTVGTDRFTLSLIIALSLRAAVAEPSPTNVGTAYHNVIGGVAVNGLADIVVDVQLQRVVGTGTATAAAGVFSSLGYIFIPQP